MHISHREVFSISQEMSWPRGRIEGQAWPAAPIVLFNSCCSKKDCLSRVHDVSGCQNM